MSDNSLGERDTKILQCPRVEIISAINISEIKYEFEKVATYDVEPTGFLEEWYPVEADGICWNPLVVRNRAHRYLVKADGAHWKL
jgi:ribulose 1,5-bisphosphate synthetase/thiazole synthase